MKKKIRFLSFDSHEFKKYINNMPGAFERWIVDNSYPPLPLPGGDFKK
jgi:hypothetical protein